MQSSCLNVVELEQAFKEAVDDYLLDCEKLGREPAKSCKGSFNVQIGPELHKHALIAARENNLNLNEFVKQPGYFHTSCATRNRFPPSIFAISSPR